MPFAVPLLCLFNYTYFMNRDFQSFCLSTDEDAEKAREQYEILHEFSYFNSFQNEFMEKIDNFRKDSSSEKAKNE